MQQPERWFWLLSTLATVVLLARLWNFGLLPTYRFFASYLLFDVIRSAFVFSSTTIYAWMWVTTEPLLWLLYIVVVLELYSLVFKNYPGIATMGRWAVMGTLSLSFIVALLTLLVDVRASQEYPILQGIFVIDRVVCTSLMLFLILINVFLLSFPVTLTRNVVSYCIGYFVYFAGKMASLFFQNLHGTQVIRIVSTIVLLISVGCLAYWVLFLSRRGEQLAVRLGARAKPEDEERILVTLNTINNTLLRTARK